VEFKEELESKSAPRIKKAAAKIAKQRVEGYEDLLLSALALLIEKPKSWQAQSQLIRAIGITGSDRSVSCLRELSVSDFDATILYIDLGFAICRLNDLQHNRLDYLKSILASSNELLMSGACSALLYEKTVPSERDMVEIIDAIKDIDTNEGQIFTPRCYIAALAYLWPVSVTRPFLEKCLQSKWNGMVEIATSSLKGERSKYVLV